MAETAPGASGVTSLRFFSPAQARVAESVRYVSGATNTSSQNARRPSYGTAPRPLPEKTSKDALLRQMAIASASTGSSQGAALPSPTQTDTSARVAEVQTMEPKTALGQRKHEPLTPYRRHAWAQELTRLALAGKYPLLLSGLSNGFSLSVPRISRTYTPPNHASVNSLLNVYNDIILNEFSSGRYIGPFSRSQLEAEIGPFQSSPLSLVPKTSKPGMYRAVHNFSHPHNPTPEAASINSRIDSDAFPCTWGTFATVALLIARLPPGSQAAVRDVAEAYRTIPVTPSEWPGLVVRLQAHDQFAVNTCNNFGLSSAGGVYGMVADAGADIFRGNGMGPLAKWVDDHIFFRIPREHLTSYNRQRAEWHSEILAHGARRHEGGRIWYGGKHLPSGLAEEFDEDCSTDIVDWANACPRTPEERRFSYAERDIDQLSERLGIRWEASKSVPFGVEVPYLGFLWNLRTCVVRLLDTKRIRYLAAITEWERKRTHNLLETQKLYGKLLHAALVFPAGRAHLTSMEAMLASFNNGPFLPHTPPRDTPDDLDWWKRQLRQPAASKPILRPQTPIDYQAFSDASSGFGVAVTIGPRWRAWQLIDGWKSQGRDIQWAEAVGFELLAIYLCTLARKGEHVTLHGDNRGVVEGWWKGCSTNRPTNRIFRRVIQLAEDHNRVFYTKYIPSKQNPADGPSRGLYPPTELLLAPIDVPSDVRPFLMDIEP